MVVTADAGLVLEVKRIPHGHVPAPILSHAESGRHLRLVTPDGESLGELRRPTRIRRALHRRRRVGGQLPFRCGISAC